jgi:ketosteroid isomerase-like protein
MSQQNIQLVKDLYALFLQRNLPEILERLSPDFTLVQSLELPWGGTYRGHEGYQQFVSVLTTHLENRALPIERYLDAGDHVVAIGRTQGVVRATGKSFDVPLAHVWQIQNNLVLAFRPFIDNPTMHESLGR